MKGNKKVVALHSDVVRPEAGKEIMVRTFSLTESDVSLLDELKGNLGVSRSALIRILLKNYKQEYTDKAA